MEEEKKVENEIQETSAKIRETRLTIDSLKAKLKLLQEEETTTPSSIGFNNSNNNKSATTASVDFRVATLKDIVNAEPEFTATQTILFLKKDLEALEWKLTGKRQQQQQQGETALFALDDSIQVTYGSDCQLFRITAASTFLDLTNEACRFWGVERAMLRDENNSIWPSSATVYGEIQRCYQSNKKKPTIVLFNNIVSERKETGTFFLNVPSETAAAAAAALTTSSPPATAVSKKTMQSPESNLELYLKQKEAESALKLANKKKQAKIQQVRTLSLFFHDGEHVNRNYNRHFGWGELFFLFCWIFAFVLVFSLTTVTMVFRFSTSYSYLSASSVRHDLGYAPFVSPNLNGLLVEKSLLPQDTINSKQETVTDPTDVFAWMKQIFIPFLAAQSPAQIFHQNVMVRQSRVNNVTGCYFINAIPPASRSLACFPQYTYGNSQTSNLSTVNDNSFDVYNSTACDVVLYGKFAAYDRGGFAFNLYNTSSNKDNLTAGMVHLVNSLQSSLWVNSNSTRLVSIVFNLANLDLSWVQRVTIMLEVNYDSLLHTSITNQIFPLSMYASNYLTNYAPLFIVSDVLLILYSFIGCVCFVVLPYVREEKSFFMICSTVWNVVFLVLLPLSLTMVFMCVAFEVSIAKQVTNVSTSTLSVFQYYNDILYLACACQILLVFSVFKFLQIFTGFSLLFQSVHRASHRLIMILFLFVVALAAMSIWAYVSFGSSVETYSNLTSSAFTVGSFLLTRMFNYSEIRASESYQLFFVFLFFFVLVFFNLLVLVNFVGAVIMDAYFEVRFAFSNEKDKQDEALGMNILKSPYYYVRKTKEQ